MDMRWMKSETQYIEIDHDGWLKSKHRKDGCMLVEKIKQKVTQACKNKRERLEQ